ncbi:MAG: putative thymidylate synthase [Candidatus Saccharibacteria bacterium]|nr:putative thymidylate synthase [Candidatus Saccharibacteria bacterium]
MNKGRYIVLEGPEGVGKTTQITELARRLQAAGFPVRTLREPDSQSDLTARALRQLTQDPRYPMNTVTEVLLYNAARSQSLQVIKKSVEQGIICIVDRNYLTTLAIQYYGRGDVPDYETINRIISFAVNGVEPDLTIVMDAPVSVLAERAKGRGAGERFDNLDTAFLERVRAGYLWEAKQRDLSVIFATDDSDTVSNKIWELVSRCLSSRDGSTSTKPEAVKDIIQTMKADVAPHEPPLNAETAAPAEAASTVTKVEPAEDVELVTKKDGRSVVTAAGEDYLQTVVTNTTGNVYAFNENLSPVTIAAAMARLSRRGDDMRITLLDEFAGKMGKDGKLLQRVITAYGDDSVQQLAGIHFVVENASNLLTKKLEWGRLAAYLEQSTRYIYFDQKDDKGRYKYYMPKDFDKKTKATYKKTMDTIFDLYSDMVHKLTDYVVEHSDVPEAERDGAFKGATRAQACDAIRPVLPVAVKSTVGIFASGQALESLIMHLQSDPLPEAQETGKHLLNEARQVVPMFLERADKPERGGALIAYRANTNNAVAELAQQELPANHSVDAGEPVTLTDLWPRNELDLVADMLYEHSSLPLKDIQAEVATWPYAKKQAAFNTYMGERLNRRHRPGRALEKAHYSWDIVCDYGIFRDLQRHRMVDDLEWQALTPRYGYDIPQLVEDAGLSDQFEQCFDLSLQLYSQLQSAGYALEAQYATLLGHRMRWKITYNAREAFHFHELRTSPQGHPGYRKLVLEMHNKLAEVHPMMADAMKFVNQGEDESLTRLAAERYTQFKLDQLS